MYYTYILFSQSHNRYYVGHCENLDLRFARHNKGGVPSTKKYKPWEVVYFETFETRSLANQRELKIKKMKSRLYIEQLVSKFGG